MGRIRLWRCNGQQFDGRCMAQWRQLCLQLQNGIVSTLAQSFITGTYTFSIAIISCHLCTQAQSSPNSHLQCRTPPTGSSSSVAKTALRGLDSETFVEFCIHMSSQSICSNGVTTSISSTNQVQGYGVCTNSTVGCVTTPSSSSSNLVQHTDCQ